MGWIKGMAGRTEGRAIPAILFGMAHAFDLGGTLAHRRGRFGRGAAGDAEALRQDWIRASAAAQSNGRAHA
ncbi:MAG TPA: hypothetical protein VFY65_06455 [Longimicrobium sp.]|nr:hypothetical protein [Longimicrobium sp.]